jgi:trigger factor
MNPNEFAQMLDSSGQVNALVGEVSRRKALAAVLAGATVKDTAGNVVDMEAFTSAGDDAEDADADAQSAEAADEAPAEAAEEN